MKLFLVCGCSKESEMERRQAMFVMRQLQARGHSVSLFDLSMLPLDCCQDLPSVLLYFRQPQFAHALQLMRSADAIMIISNDYNSLMPTAVLQLTELCPRGQLDGNSYVWNHGETSCVIVGRSIRQQKVAKELWAILSTSDRLDLSDILPFGLPKVYTCDPNLETPGPCVV